jgi:hypothetical protein
MLIIRKSSVAFWRKTSEIAVAGGTDSLAGSVQYTTVVSILRTVTFHPL